MVKLRDSLEDTEKARIRQLVQNIPVPVLDSLVQKWRGKPLSFTEENKCQQFEAAFQDLPRSWKLQLERLYRLTALAPITWAPNQIDGSPMIDPSQFKKPVKFSTDDLITTDIAVQGYLHVFPLDPEIYLLAMEFRSRSIKYRDTFRYLLIPDKKLLFVEQKENSLEFFEEIWNNILAVTLKELPIRPVIIRQVVRQVEAEKKENYADEKINLLQITLSQVISGFTGLSGIILAGEDVMDGMHGMKVRHDLSIDFSDLGPWTEVQTDKIHLIVGEGIRFKDLEGISKAIELFAPEKASQ
jgi:hypothetical protein